MTKQELIGEIIKLMDNDEIEFYDELLNLLKRESVDNSVDKEDK